MSHNPTTFAGESGGEEHFDWDDAAVLHHRGNGSANGNGAGAGMLNDFTGARRGSFADLIRYVANLPEDDRREYTVERAGDREYQHFEVTRLYQRADFPRSAG